ncbi:outer membrane beta-barrel protein [Ekhidna sp.]
MRVLLSVLLVVIFSTISYGQYWFGPKVGFNYIQHNYQDVSYRDTFNIKNDLNFHVGGAFSYSATDKYSVYIELLYERIGKSVRDIASDGANVRTSMTNHFISMPAMLRITLGKVPFHYYVNGGPRVSYWLAGKGTQFLEEFVEQLPDPEMVEDAFREYKVVFKRSKVDGDDTALIQNPNRVQFGLTVGGGIYFDLQGGGRLLIDARYTWVHSNMGENSSSDNINFNFTTYSENFEYSHNITSIGVAYMFGYNSELKRKGKSSNKESNKKKKKKN